MGLRFNCISNSSPPKSQAERHGGNPCLSAFCSSASSSDGQSNRLLIGRSWVRVPPGAQDFKRPRRLRKQSAGANPQRGASPHQETTIIVGSPPWKVKESPHEYFEHGAESKSDFSLS